MNMSAYLPRRTAVLLCSAAAALALFTGCSQVSAPVQTTMAAPAPDPNTFPWQNTAISATGRGRAPAGTSSAQRTLVAQNAARVAAIKDLKQSVRQLPVGTDLTVGAIMDNYMGIRRAIEKELQKAELVGEQPLEAGEYQVEVRAQLQAVAEILKKNNITPSEELPKPPSRGDELGVPAVS